MRGQNPQQQGRGQYGQFPLHLHLGEAARALAAGGGAGDRDQTQSARATITADFFKETQIMFWVDSFTGLSKWAASFAQAGSGPGARLAGIVVHQESTVYRYVPELSIRPEARKAENK
ncbi:MAG: hypothetical protein ACREEM_41855 [Blastocatellia bacterium]